jgi:hypothetical protein
MHSYTRAHTQLCPVHVAAALLQQLLLLRAAGTHTAAVAAIRVQAALVTPVLLYHSSISISSIISAVEAVGSVKPSPINGSSSSSCNQHWQHQ